MRVSDLLAELRTLQLKVAGYEELCLVVQRWIDTDYEIPVEIEPGRIPKEVLEALKADLEAMQEQIHQRLELIEQLEVSDGLAQDLGLDGDDSLGA